MSANDLSMQTIRDITCLLLVLLLGYRADDAVARHQTSVTRLAEPFIRFCLDRRMSPDVAMRLAEQLGATEIPREAIDAEQKVWR